MGIRFVCNREDQLDVVATGGKYQSKARVSTQLARVPPCSVAEGVNGGASNRE